MRWYQAPENSIRNGRAMLHILPNELYSTHLASLLTPSGPQPRRKALKTLGWLRGLILHLTCGIDYELWRWQREPRRPLDFSLVRALPRPGKALPLFVNYGKKTGGRSGWLGKVLRGCNMRMYSHMGSVRGSNVVGALRYTCARRRISTHARVRNLPLLSKVIDTANINSFIAIARGGGECL